MSRDAAQSDWRNRLTTAAEAVSVVRPGDHVFVGSACATPRALVDALEQLAAPPPGAVLVHFLTDGIARGDPPATRYRHRVFYIGRDVLALAGTGEIEYVPVSLPEVPALFANGRLPLEVAMLQVAPPDEEGHCSLGISVDITRAAALTARTVVAEINPAMPRTRGESRIPADRIDHFVPVDTPIVEYLHEPADGVAEQIARYVARLIDDRSTLQVGLGRVPNQMLSHLTNRRELAIHSDVVTEPVADLVAAGVVTGNVVASWAMGTRRLYDLVDDDPRFAFHPLDHVCDPAVIAAQERMVSVTQAFAIDLTGQVCTESLDGRLYGGLSTGPAFHRGALASPGGLAIVCLASRAPGGRPAIRTELEPGEAVAIARGDVHWVVTEYGTAYLFGRSLAERAVALIEIAHPDDREELLRAAAERGLVHADQSLRSRTAYPEAEERDAVLKDGREVGIRPTRTTDASAMQELFYRLPDEDVRTRFFQNLKSLTDAAAQHLCSVDYEGEMAFAAVVGPRDRQRIVGTVSYYVDPRTGLADVGYMVDPEWQGAGLGGILHARAVEYAQAHGVRGFTADVMLSNSRMLHVFRHGGHEVSVTTEGGISEVTMIFSS
ncbi:MAG TPA: GNAT family N-acetyltransferase [Gaiellaceae bacterium]|nr:GNAT family N-acetyltransferase [Gaiellaceae bacterium]